MKKVQALQTAYRTLTKCAEFCERNNLKVNTEELKFGLYIADQKKLKLQKGYYGFGGIICKRVVWRRTIGAWVTSFEKDDLHYSTEVIKDALDVNEFAEISSYMFGDIIAKKQGYQPVGLSPFAGYAVGYQAVQAFMKNNNVGIGGATLLGTNEIINNCQLFT